jgi:hypothetical protein
MSSDFNQLRVLINQHFNKLKKLLKNEDVWYSGENYFIQGDKPNEWLKAKKWQIDLINLKNIKNTDSNQESLGKYKDNIYYYYFDNNMSSYENLIFNLTTDIKYNIIKIILPSDQDEIKIKDVNKFSDLNKHKILSVDIISNINKFINKTNFQIKEITNDKLYPSTIAFIKSDKENEWYESENWQNNIINKLLDKESKFLFPYQINDNISKAICNYNSINYLCCKYNKIFRIIDLDTGENTWHAAYGLGEFEFESKIDDKIKSYIQNTIDTKTDIPEL